MLDTTSEHFPFSGYYVFDDSYETEQSMQNSCKYVTLEQYNANVNACSSSITIMNLNCRSLLKNVDSVEVLFASMEKVPDICMFSETWLSPKSLLPCFEGLSGFHNFRQEQTGGGVSVFIGNNYVTSDIIQCDSQTCESIGKIVTINSVLYLVVCVYRPPSGDIEMFFGRFRLLLVKIA